MDRTCGQCWPLPSIGLPSGFGLALGACLTVGCASPGQLSESSGRGSPPACACQSTGDTQSKPKNGASNPAAHPVPHTVGQAWRAFVDCLHSPLSQCGPAINVGEGTSRHRCEPLSSRRRRALLPAHAGHERRRGAIRHRFEPRTPRRRRAKRSGRGTETTHGR